MHTSRCLHTYTHPRTPTHTLTPSHTHPHTHTLTQTHTPSHTSSHTYTHAHTHTHINIHTYPYMQAVHATHINNITNIHPLQAQLLYLFTHNRALQHTEKYPQLFHTNVERCPPPPFPFPSPKPCHQLHIHFLTARLIRFHLTHTQTLTNYIITDLILFVDNHKLKSLQPFTSNKSFMNIYFYLFSTLFHLG